MEGGRFCELHQLILDRVKASVQPHKYKDFKRPLSASVKVTHIEPAPKPKPPKAPKAKAIRRDSPSIRKRAEALAELVKQEGHIRKAAACKELDCSPSAVDNAAKVAIKEGWLRSASGYGGGFFATPGNPSSEAA